MTKMMKLNYDDEKNSYGNDLIKKAQFLQRTENRLRILDAFLAQINDVFDEQTADAIKKQIDNLQYQLWQREVDRVENGIKTRRKHAKEKAEKQAKKQAKKEENSDDSENNSENSDEVKNNVVPEIPSNDGAVTPNQNKNNSSHFNKSAHRRGRTIKRHEKRRNEKN